MISQYISSPMNYIGGKYKLLPQLFPLFPEDVGTFVDLFCGGANVGVNATASKIIFNDNLTYLMDLYNAFQQNPLDVTVSYVENRIADFNLSLTNQEGYLKLRAEYNTHRNPLDLFASNIEKILSNMLSLLPIYLMITMLTFPPQGHNL